MQSEATLDTALLHPNDNTFSMTITELWTIELNSEANSDN